MGQLKKKFHAVNKKYYPARQRMTLPAKEGQKSGEVLKDSAKLSEYGLSSGSVVLFKDLGTQVRDLLQGSSISACKGQSMGCKAEAQQQSVGPK